jgi:lysyl-tRNA synthetase class 2
VDVDLLRRRARVFREIRNFFDSRDYLEVDTPLLAPDLIPESCLEVFETKRIVPAGPELRSRPYWLIPSPEIWMKKLIAKDRRNIYQICKCFRNSESSGFLHSPEFTMLEYYTMDAGYLDSLSITEELFASLEGIFRGETAACGMAGEPRIPFLRITVEDAFERWAGFNLFAAAEEGGLEKEARRLGLDPPPGLGAAALYDLIFIHAVEPSLPRDRPTALTDYPAFVPCLARKGRDGRTVERWELYVRGVELANCYSEETEAEKVRAYFEAEGKIKNGTSLVPHLIDGDYWKIFLPGPRNLRFPACSGVALGLDRLIMALSGRPTINGTLPFPMEEL